MQNAVAAGLQTGGATGSVAGPRESNTVGRATAAGRAMAGAGMEKAARATEAAPTAAKATDKAAVKATNKATDKAVVKAMAAAKGSGKVSRDEVILSL